MNNAIEFLKYWWPQFLIVYSILVTALFFYQQRMFLAKTEFLEDINTLRTEQISMYENDLHNLNEDLLKMSSKDEIIVIPKGTKFVRNLKTGEDKIVRLPETWIAELRLVNESKQTPASSQDETK
ncbi:hypothetical protein DO021_15455 [Desulfobacter hydrogenophilus]|uniref:Uncharacterized protein n=1 Tax=Desulfobacter hydrogenophilus TaxID=2291 RepID=A0A328F8S0_9BACT|nr:hypothetical protein [Desulfobacter hydrogenophilus]NDY73078.1 hypothetical protein [Desulfobacter hydrogenophilus]QBH13572.1 hypothetical protein EYB58_11930 [Desulfobacter hydrogenophilus]RAM01084.1 hypothetical protein DO021_15455 [Desulfobacter hydrogenophilus]